MNIVAYFLCFHFIYMHSYIHRGRNVSKCVCVCVIKQTHDYVGVLRMGITDVGNGQTE